MPIPPPPTNPAGPDQPAAPSLPLAAQVLTQEAVTEALGSDVPPRDAAERVTFATWAIVTGKSPGGIFNALPALDDETAEKMAQRLSERAEGTITVEDVKNSPTIEALATIVREHLEAGELDGFVRTLRAPKEGSTSVPVFVFHAGGRFDGGLRAAAEPAARGHPDVRHRTGRGFDRGARGRVRAEAAGDARNGPFILAGWSLGGVLAYACAIGLKQAGADVRFVGLIDAVRAGEEVPQTKEETRARWDRYARFAERTFNVQIPAIPYEQLEELDDEGQVQFVLDVVKAERCADPRRHHRAPAHVVSGQPGDRHRRDPSPTTGTSRCTWPTATTTTRSCSSRATPPASPTAAGASSSPTWRSCRSAASTSRRSTSRTSPRSART